MAVDFGKEAGVWAEVLAGGWFGAGGLGLKFFKSGGELIYNIFGVGKAVERSENGKRKKCSLH